MKQAQITKIRNIKSGISTLITGIKNYMRISEKKALNFKMYVKWSYLLKKHLLTKMTGQEIRNINIYLLDNYSI